MGNCASYNTVKEWGEYLERKKYVECTRMVEIRTRKMFLAVGKACTAIFGPTTGF